MLEKKSMLKTLGYLVNEDNLYNLEFLVYILKKSIYIQWQIKI
jgi:hypothetical protein